MLKCAHVGTYSLDYNLERCQYRQHCAAMLVKYAHTEYTKSIDRIGVTRIASQHRRAQSINAHARGIRVQSVCPPLQSSTGCHSGKKKNTPLRTNIPIANPPQRKQPKQLPAFRQTIVVFLTMLTHMTAHTADRSSPPIYR